LTADLKSDISKYFHQFVASLLQGRRPETTQVNTQSIQKDAQSLVNAGGLKCDTNETLFNVLLCDRSDEQLRRIFNEYAKLTGKSIGEQEIGILNCHLFFFFSFRGIDQERCKW
jgi:hypothetical protein